MVKIMDLVVFKRAWRRLVVVTRSYPAGPPRLAGNVVMGASNDGGADPGLVADVKLEVKGGAFRIYYRDWVVVMWMIRGA